MSSLKEQSVTALNWGLFCTINSFRNFDQNMVVNFVDGATDTCKQELYASFTV